MVLGCHHQAFEIPPLGNMASRHGGVQEGGWWDYVRRTSADDHGHDELELSLKSAVVVAD
jgi:hypothetical protein